MYFWHEHDFDKLRASRQGRHHALLLTGPPGIGKSAFARAWAAALLCEQISAEGRACGRCSACAWFAQGSHPDFRTLIPEALDPFHEPTGKGAKPARDIRIDQVRALAGFVSVGGHRGGSKVILVDPADCLNAASGNALLKTLEEPSGDTRFLLVSSRPDWLPATIRSRCAVVPLRPPSIQQAVAWLVEEHGLSATEAARLLAAAGGAPLRALELAEPELGAAHRLVLDALAKLPQASLIATAERLSGVEPAQWVAILQTWVAELARVYSGATARFFPEHGARLETLARQTDLLRISELETSIRRLTRYADHPLNPKLLCENALVAYCSLFEGSATRQPPRTPG